MKTYTSVVAVVALVLSVALAFQLTVGKHKAPESKEHARGAPHSASENVKTQQKVFIPSTTTTQTVRVK